MKNEQTTKELMLAACNQAIAGLRANAGGPFGAIVVHSNAIIARAHNQVIETHDPTAHAEIMAIRKASEFLGRFDLSDCEIYSSCEPCPMCFSAIYWARIGKLYFAASRSDAGNVGFDDKVLYDIFAGTKLNNQFETLKLDDPAFGKPFEEWLSKTDKIMY